MPLDVEIDARMAFAMGGVASLSTGLLGSRVEIEGADERERPAIWHKLLGE